ncbi:MAG: glycosyltransferase [Desulfobacteraceae bacterium]|nr:MAG: glycosyltransferase [Desulfobacteraceae bacterium]
MRNHTTESSPHPAVAFIVTHYPPATGFGGVCESGYGLSSAMAKIGLPIDVVTSDAGKDVRIPFQSFRKYEQDNLKIHPFRYVYNERSCFSFSSKKWIQSIIKKNDIVYVNGIYTHPATIGARCARQAKKPHIVATRNGLDPWMMRIKYIKKMLGFFTYVKTDLLGTDCIHVTAEREMEACIGMGIKGPFTIIPNGIDVSRFAVLPDTNRSEIFWPILKGRKVVLFMSRLSKQKGLDMLIPLWRHIIKKYPDALLVIAGPDYLGYGETVRQMANNSEYSDSILFTGNVEGERKLSLLSRAEIFILPSYSENFGNVVAEAMACSVPVITTRETPWQELDQVGCGCCVPAEENFIRDALDGMLSLNDHERKQMGVRGKKIISEKYTWDIAARKLITVCHAVLNGSDIPLYPTPWGKE